MSTDTKSAHSSRQALRTSCASFLAYGAISTHKKSTDVEKRPVSSGPDATMVTRLGWRMAFYVFVMHGVGAGLISGGVNFLIAWAMYKHTTDPICLFAFPNTLAGDAALTVFIQTGITWICEAIIVRADIRHGKISPAVFIREPTNGRIRWFFALDSANGESIGAFVWFNLARALAIAIPVWCILWGSAMGIMVAVGSKEVGTGDYLYEADWTGPVFKLVYAGILAMVTTPVMAGFWVLKAGWARQRREEGREVLVGCPVEVMIGEEGEGVAVGGGIVA